VVDALFSCALIIADISVILDTLIDLLCNTITVDGLPERAELTKLVHPKLHCLPTELPFLVFVPSTIEVGSQIAAVLVHIQSVGQM
jgi:hypothetical protein